MNKYLALTSNFLKDDSLSKKSLGFLCDAFRGLVPFL